MKRGLDRQVGLVVSAIGMMLGSAVGGMGDSGGPKSSPIPAFVAEIRPASTVIEAEPFGVAYGLEGLTDEIVSSEVTRDPELR